MCGPCWSGFSSQADEGPLDTASVGFDPTGGSVESLGEADVADDPSGGASFVARVQFAAGVEEGTFAAFVEVRVAINPLEFEGDGTLWGWYIADSRIGGGLAVAGVLGSGAAGIAARAGFAGGGASPVGLRALARLVATRFPEIRIAGMTWRSLGFVGPARRLVQAE